MSTERRSGRDKILLRFSYRIEVFTAERTGEWAFVTCTNGLHWFVCNVSGASRICAHSSGSPNDSYCQYQFVDGAIVVNQENRRLKNRHGEAWVDAPSAHENQEFMIIPMAAPKPPPIKSCCRTRLFGDFQIRHIATGKYLAVTEEPWDSLACTLEFKDAGTVFHAESDGEWTRIVWKDDLFWFLLEAHIPSHLGLNKASDRSSAYCLFKFVDGYIYDRQLPDRVLSVGKDGRAWGLRKTQGSPEQQFELIVGDEETEEIKMEGSVSKALVFDSCLIDKFE
jgi:hypothetical protein